MVNEQRKITELAEKIFMALLANPEYAHLTNHERAMRAFEAAEAFLAEEDTRYGH